jgi:archaemetzincin
MSADKITLALLQPIETALAADLAAHIEARFARSCTILPAYQELDFAYDIKRGQHNSTAILARIKATLARSARTLLAIVNDDIYSAGVNFVFGEAEVGGRVAVISLARLNEEFWQKPRCRPLLYARACKEATHELGHIFALHHCDNQRCVMYFSRTLADTDHKSDRFCPDCAHTLAERFFGQ